MNYFTIPLPGKTGNEIKDLQDLKETMIDALFMHPGIAEILNDDQQAMQLSMIYFAAHDRLIELEREQ